MKSGEKDTLTQREPPKTLHITGLFWRRGLGEVEMGQNFLHATSNLWPSLNLQWPLVIYCGQTYATTAGLQTREGASDRFKMSKLTKGSSATEALLLLIWITFTNDRPQRHAARTTLWNWLLRKFKSHLTAWHSIWCHLFGDKNKMHLVFLDSYVTAYVMHHITIMLYDGVWVVFTHIKV